MSDHTGEAGEFELVSVYRAPDEVTAHLVKGVLEDAGIECMVASRQVPWMDGIMVHGEGYWGDVLTAEDKHDESVALIEAYLAAPPAITEAEAEGGEEQS